MLQREFGTGKDVRRCSIRNAPFTGITFRIERTWLACEPHDIYRGLHLKGDMRLVADFRCAWLPLALWSA